MIKISTSISKKALSSQINTCGNRRYVIFWWLGQAGFALRYYDKLILIDPYLSDSLAQKYKHSFFKHQRLMAVPIKPELLTGCDFFFCTHGHTDHMDGDTISGVLQNSEPFFVIPRAEKEKGGQRGIPRQKMMLMNSGETIHLGDFITVTAIPSAHEELHTDVDGNHYYLGYVIDFNGLRIYHSGDSVPYPGLAANLAQMDIHLAFLPINGRDEYRCSHGVPGNMELDEAVDLCMAARIPNLVCHHFEMFSFNTIEREFSREFLENKQTDLSWQLPEIGIKYIVQLNESIGDENSE